MKNRTHWRWPVAGLVAHAASLSIAQAQTAPLRNSPAPAPAAAASAPLLAPIAQGRFLLREVRFSPTKAVSAAELQAIVKPFIGKLLDATDLTVISTAVRRLYESRGLGMAGVGYPAQDLTAGVLQVGIVEPQVAQITIESSPQPPVSRERTLRVLEASGVRSGQPLDLGALDRAMFTLNDWPGVSAKTTLVPSADEGQYKVNVQTERRRAWDASVEADNHGSSAGGRNRIGTLLRWNNPTGIGDNLDLRLMASGGADTTVGRLGYETPVGPTPWRAGLGVSRVGYELSEEFAGATGTANVFDASLSYPLLRGRNRNLVTRLAVQHKKLEDRIADASSTDKSITAFDASLAFESRDNFGGGGFTGGSLGVMAGRLKYSDGAVAGAPQGSFSKLSVQVSRLQAIGKGFTLLTGLAGQWTDKLLDNAERITLGGDKGVRAYPVAEGSSDLGAIVNVELRRWFNPVWSAYTFYDWGYGRDKAQDMLTGDDSRTLHGYGLGVQFTHPEWFTLKASLGLRGKEPVRSESDNPKARLLVQIQRSF